LSAPDIRICFVGDSFTAGTGDPEALGWVGRVMAAALAQGRNLTAYNLGIRRETSSDMLRRWKQEVEPRVMPGTEMRVVFCFGANDTAMDNGRRRVALDETLANARKMLREAKTKYPVLLIGPPPVVDTEHDERIAELARELATVARDENVPCLDVFTPLMGLPRWRQEAAANDGSHPRSAGYSELANLVLAWPEWWFHKPRATTPQPAPAEHIIRIVESDADIAACYPVMAQLRPHIAAADFVARVRRQMADGYRLAFLQESGNIIAVAGYRLSEDLAGGRFLYVDDLVTDTAQRSRGWGGILLSWIKDEALRNGCAYFDLDSGVQRIDAHRFYLRTGMSLTGYHFVSKLAGKDR